jgi:hypothetical protein
MKLLFFILIRQLMDALFYIMGCYERPEFHDIMEVLPMSMCV